MNGSVRVTMNEFLAQKLNKSSKKDSIYSPLTDEMDALELTPVKPSPLKLSSPRSRNKEKLLSFSRRLFCKNSGIFKTQKRSSLSSRNSQIGGRIRTIFSDMQNKVQAWTQEIKGNINEKKTPNCVTPDRRIRYMLGRTPEKLYSPFGIETPPTHFQKYSSRDLMEYPFSAFHEWLTPPKRKSVRKELKLDLNPF